MLDDGFNRSSFNQGSMDNGLVYGGTCTTIVSALKRGRNVDMHLTTVFHLVGPLLLAWHTNVVMNTTCMLWECGNFQGSCLPLARASSLVWWVAYHTTDRAYGWVASSSRHLLFSMCLCAHLHVGSVWLVVLPKLHPMSIDPRRASIQVIGFLASML